MKRFWVICLAIAVWTPATAQNKDVKWPDCYCTDKGGARVELGELRCMFVDGRNFTARCEMSLNNPMWREVNEGCLSSENDATQPVDVSG